MSNSLDLNLLPLLRDALQERLEFYGLYTAEPPRRTARGRDQDRLVLYLTMIGNAPLPPGKQEQVLADLSGLFYQTPGSVTAALRAVAEQLNRLLLERNLRLSSGGRQGLALFCQMVLRGDQIYLAHSGGIHTFLLSADQPRHFFDADGASKFLGQSRVAPISFFTANLHPNDTLILASKPLPAWDARFLAGVHGQSLEGIRRRLMVHGDSEINAVVIQAKPGKGKLLTRPLTPASVFPSTPSKAESTQPERVIPVETISQALAPPDVEQPVPEEGKPVEKAPASQDESPKVRRIAAPASTLKVGSKVRPAVVGAPKPSHPPFGSRLAPLGKFLVSVGSPLARFSLRLLRGVQSLLVRLLPGEPFKAIPSTVMAFIALAVPVVVVTIASIVYFQLGHAAQYDRLFSQAQQMAIQALGQTNIQARRADWDAVLEILDQAEEHRITPETQALRAQARSALDELELIRRVSYQPVIVGGLPIGSSVSRIVVSDGDLYLLDSNNGTVMRAVFGNSGYEIDATFQCGSNQPPISATAAVVDILPWPAGYQEDATILALEADGNLLYCRPGNIPEVKKLAPPLTGSWGKLVGFALDLNNLYLLDPPANAVWAYWKIKIQDPPHLFFDEQIPFMQDVVDLVVDRDDLYLLHADGHLTLCVYNDLEAVPTRCTDTPYVDFRPGRENLPIVISSPFSHLMNTPSPDPSLFFLEPDSQTVFHFSLRNLVLKYQYLSLEPLPKYPASAFWVDTARRSLFLAIGNQIYFATLP